jgi:hypothetical protein
MPRQAAALPPATSALTSDRLEVQQITRLLQKSPLGLRDYFEIGTIMQRLADDPTLRRRGARWRERLAELVTCSISTLNKALHFRRSYAESDLPILEELGVGWSRLTIALVVRDPRKRRQFLEKAKAEAWSDRDLHRAIQGQRGILKTGGRPRRTARSQGIVGDLAELLRLTRPWIDFHDSVIAPGKEGYEKEARKLSGDAETSLRELLDRAGPQLKDLARRIKEVRAWLDTFDIELVADEEMEPDEE